MESLVQGVLIIGSSCLVPSGKWQPFRFQSKLDSRDVIGIEQGCFDRDIDLGFRITITAQAVTVFQHGASAFQKAFQGTKFFSLQFSAEALALDHDAPIEGRFKFPIAGEQPFFCSNHLLQELKGIGQASFFFVEQGCQFGNDLQPVTGIPKPIV